MSDEFNFDPPVPDHMADTGPIRAIPDHLADTGPVRAIRDRDAIPAWRRVIGLLFLLGATGLTIGAIVLYMTPPPSAPTPDHPIVTQGAGDATTVPPPTQAPQVIENPNGGETINVVRVIPTISPDQAAQLLGQPLEAAAPVDVLGETRDIYNPFTIIPERTRSEVEKYTIVAGDTIFSIAERYGLKPETIAWGNDRRIITSLRPGREINILPVDGVYHQVLGSQTIADIAKAYNVDPYTIIDADYNGIFGATPETVLPSGTWLVVPGGTAEQISWNPVVERTGGDGSGGGSGAQISFSPGDPGSCGLVPNPGGGGGWIRPIEGYEFMRGFSSWHTGVDLSAPVGTPVYAANGGVVIFAGWNSWGYGYTVVLAHGAFTTVYGHLSGINVGCRQIVSAGQVIAASGNSGNSSGPHLHFEIRYNDVPQDPTYTMSF